MRKSCCRRQRTSSHNILSHTCGNNYNSNNTRTTQKPKDSIVGSITSMSCRNERRTEYFIVDKNLHRLLLGLDQKKSNSVCAVCEFSFLLFCSVLFIKHIFVTNIMNQSRRTHGFLTRTHTHAHSPYKYERNRVWKIWFFCEPKNTKQKSMNNGMSGLR